MVKPTSKLNYDIITFVYNDPRIQTELASRDNHAHTFGINLNCRFFKKHPTDSKKSSYIVSFKYRVPQNLEPTDDISVMVEVEDSNPVNLKILQIRKY